MLRRLLRSDTSHALPRKSKSHEPFDPWLKMPAVCDIFVDSIPDVSSPILMKYLVHLAWVV